MTAFIIFYMVLQIVALVLMCSVFFIDDLKTSYMAMCVADGIIAGSSAVRLIPCSVLFSGDMFDIIINVIFLLAFSFYLYNNYKNWKSL